MEIGRFAFLTPWGVSGNDLIHLTLIRKRVVYFLSVLIELFRQVLRPMHYEQISIENR